MNAQNKRSQYRPSGSVLVRLFAAAAVTAVTAAVAISAIFPDVLPLLRLPGAVIALPLGILIGLAVRSWPPLRDRVGRAEKRPQDPTNNALAGERQLRGLIDAVPVLISYVDRDQRYRVCNKAYEEWFGITVDQVAGKHINEVLSEEDYRSLLPSINDALRGNTVKLESTLTDKGNQVRHVDRTLVPSLDADGAVEGFFVCASDVTGRKLREESILKSKSVIGDIVESLQEGFALFDENDRLVVSNQNYSRIFPTVADLIKPGVRFEELIHAAANRGQNVEALGSKEGWIQRRLEAHAGARGRFEHQFTDGRWIWVEEQKTFDGKTLSTYVDITHLKQREEELRRARDIAQAADAAKSEFLANMSHEFRTPLNAIMGFSEMIASQILGPVPDSYLGYANHILTSGRHLLGIVNQLLDLSKIEAGRLELTEALVDIEEFIAASAQLIEDQAKAREIELTASTAAGLPLLWGDELRLKQIALNLLSNAIKFTRVGGCVTLEACLDSSGDLRITVSDNGIGMSEEELAVALKPFGQVMGSYARDHQGTGLGLPLARSLVELHGGTLSVASSKTSGTRAAVTLPAERLRRAETQPLQEVVDGAAESVA